MVFPPFLLRTILVQLFPCDQVPLQRHHPPVSEVDSRSPSTEAGSRGRQGSRGVEVCLLLRSRDPPALQPEPFPDFPPSDPGQVLGGNQQNLRCTSLGRTAEPMGVQQPCLLGLATPCRGRAEEVKAWGGVGFNQS